jgi:hypothetical protein
MILTYSEHVGENPQTTARESCVPLHKSSAYDTARRPVLQLACFSLLEHVVLAGRPGPRGIGTAFGTCNSQLQGIKRNHYTCNLQFHITLFYPCPRRCHHHPVAVILAWSASLLLLHGEGSIAVPHGCYGCCSSWSKSWS